MVRVTGRLLVSGDDSVGVLDMDSGTATVAVMPDVYRFDNALALGSDQFVRTFGLSWHEHFGVLVACHERVGRLGQKLDHLGFLEITPLWYMTHAIAVREDVLYTCNARIDVLGVHHLFSGVEKFVDVGTGEVVPDPQHLKPLRDGYEHDRHHPNAVVVSDDHVYVLVHPIRPHGVGTEVRVLDRDELTMVERLSIDERPFGVPYADDLAIVGGTFLWCDTFRCRVRGSDGRSSAALGDDTMFLRGLAVDDRHAYVGLVTRRGISTVVAQIVRLDLADLAEVCRFDVPFGVEICTIRVIDEFDHGHPGAGIAPLLETRPAES